MQEGKFGYCEVKLKEWDPWLKQLVYLYAEKKNPKLVPGRN